jgi:membrane-bound lytic murein transglycosylase B
VSRLVPLCLAALIAFAAPPPFALADDQAPAAEAPVPPPKPDFNQWLAALRVEAQQKGIRPSTLNEALDGIQPIDRVLDFDKRQPEFTLTLDQYLAHVLTPQKIAEGRKLLHFHHKLLMAIYHRYKVPPKVIVALWGIESGFGKNIGDYPVVPALATLAYDGRRSQYFRTELLNALTIVDRGATPQQMRGSWAGAMGQCQFMPSTYLKYAQKWEGQGPADIWHTHADIFASAANYLSSVGWNPDESWGRPVKLPANFDASLLGLGVKKSVDDWAKLGVRRADGKPLPKSAIQGSIVKADPGRKATGLGPPFLLYDNFRTYLNWNRSVFFGVAAGTLADKIASR